MKIKKTYISYDGIYFDSKYECVEHESYAWDMVKELVACVKFLDKDGEELIPYELKDLEDILAWIETVYVACKYLLIKKPLSDSCDVWVINYFGYELPDEIGLYEYDFKKNEWYKSEQ